MPSPATLSFVIHKVKSVYGRMTNKIAAQLTDDINIRIEELCRQYKFWFNVLEPGQAFLREFPFSGDAAVNALVPAFGQWIDRGWLITEAGRQTYPFAYPLTMAAATGTTATVPADPPLVPANWAYGSIVRVVAIKQMTNEGTTKRDMQLLNHSDMMSNALYTKQGPPILCSFTEEAPGLSCIVFSPTPDQTYLFNVQAEMLPTRLDRPDSTSGMLLYYPRVYVLFGILEAAKYFGEKQEHAFYEDQLYGAQWAQTKDPNMAPGGLVGLMLADSRKRFVQKEQYRRGYTSSRRASQRTARSGQAYNVLPGFYFQDGSGGDSL